ncbi:hypothetical protein [Fimbriiglobus ruber]|uniref:Uncharacterized protein n=1 Tax=Fimbriiglobus ruber TaxID=1908690 RepID=A0A225DX23_9BACT|nr:hypothetical protein [Fimbriiglobus ruber]OWK45543.1 hypothetical protein FRUB_01874 [Fimbriiglobus ruber]
MSCWTLLLMLSVLFWVGVIQLLNSRSSAGKLARMFVRGLIKKLVGRSDEKSVIHENGNAKQAP